MHSKVSTLTPGHVLLEQEYPEGELLHRLLRGRLQSESAYQDAGPRHDQPEQSHIHRIDRLIWKMENPWLGEANRPETQNRFSTSSATIGHCIAEISVSPPMAWSRPTAVFQLKKASVPSRTSLDEETVEFVRQHGLQVGIAWLQEALSDFFPGMDFEIAVLPAEDGEESMLALRIYGSLSALEFRERRHAMCEVMRAAGHNNLYGIISIFQRRSRGSGWQAFSWHSSLLAE